MAVLSDLGISELTAPLLGIAVIVVGQALVIWRANAIATRRFEYIDARLKHQDECIDELRQSIAAGDRRIWESIDQTARQLANITGQWSGVLLEREAQDRRRAMEGKE